MLASDKFDTTSAYEPNKNKALNSKMPNKLVNNGSMILWDIDFPEPGIYNIYMTGIILGKPLLECGVVLPGEQTILGVFNMTPLETVAPNTTTTVGTIDVPVSGINPFFIRVKRSSGRQIIIDTISFTGPAKAILRVLDTIPNTRLWHHAAAAYVRGYFTVKNPAFVYREIIPVKWQPNTFTTIAFNGGYIGMVVGDAMGMSIWNAPNAPVNQILASGPTVTTKLYNHEGNGVQFRLPYKTVEGGRYGFMLGIKYVPKTAEIPTGATDMSCWFIDLTVPTIPANWSFVGTVRRFSLVTIGGGKGNMFSSVGGFLENPSTSNGHLYTRTVATGNSWASLDGKTWVPSSQETYSTKNWNNTSARIYPNAEGFVEYSIGGRIECPNKGLLTLERDTDTILPNVPGHLNNFILD